MILYETGQRPETAMLTKEEISKRAISASANVQEKAMALLDRRGFEEILYDMQGDLYSLAEDPNDECGGGKYKGWTPDEIKELYEVLYGEKMDE